MIVSAGSNLIPSHAAIQVTNLQKRLHCQKIIHDSRIGVELLLIVVATKYRVLGTYGLDSDVGSDPIEIPTDVDDGSQMMDLKSFSLLSHASCTGSCDRS